MLDARFPHLQCAHRPAGRCRSAGADPWSAKPRPHPPAPLPGGEGSLVRKAACQPLSEFSIGGTKIMRVRAAGVAVLGALITGNVAQAAEPNYPTRPVRIIVPYPPGGSTDPTARQLGQWLSEKFGQSVVIDNRPGAGATLGHALGAQATPDGYTLLLGTSGGL